MKNIKENKKPQQIRENSVKVTGSNPHEPVDGFIPFNPIVEDIVKHFPRMFVEKLTSAEKMVLNHFVRLSKRYKVIWVSQSTLAQWVGVDRSYVNTIIKKLCFMGVLSKDRRFALTCRYTISSFFKSSKLAKELGDLLPALKFLPIALLTLLNNSLSMKNKYKSESPQRSEVVMNQKDQVDVIQGITSMQLSTHGKVQLLAFHQSAIEHAERECLKAKNVQDAFKFFCSLAIKYSTEHGYPVDYKRVTEMKSKYGLQGTEQSVITSNIPFDEEAQPRFKQPPVPAQIKQPTPSTGRSTGYLQQADQISAQLRERRERTRARAIAMGIDISEMTMGDIERTIKSLQT